MDFAWSIQQEEALDELETLASSFFEARPVPSAFDREGWRVLAEAGVIRFSLPVDGWGGENGGFLELCGRLEALGRGGGDRGLLFALSAHLFGCAIPIVQHGTPDQVNQWGEGLASGKLVGALAVTEPEAGSGLKNMTCTAVKTSAGYLLNGTKTLITNGPQADLFVVIATTDPDRGVFGWTAFLLPRDTPGLNVETLSPTMGLQGAPMGRVLMRECQLPEEALLGKLNGGYRVFSSAMIWERPGLLAAFLGGAQRDLDKLIAHVNQRRDDRGPLAAHQAVAHRLALMKINLESARWQLFRAAWLVDRGDKKAPAAVAEAKYLVSEAVVSCAMEVFRTAGGSGWLDEWGAATALRDSLSTLFASGTADVQLNLVAASMGLKRR